MLASKFLWNAPIENFLVLKVKTKNPPNKHLKEYKITDQRKCLWKSFVTVLMWMKTIISETNNARKYLGILQYATVTNNDDNIDKSHFLCWKKYECFESLVNKYNLVESYNVTRRARSASKLLGWQFAKQVGIYTMF